MDGLRRAASLLSLVLVMTGLTWSVQGSTAVPVADKPPRGRVFVSPHVPSANVADAVTSLVPDASVGVEVYDRDHGATVLSRDADRQFPSASVVKLLIALDALSPQAPPQARDQVREMLARSDDSVASTLWDADGGPAIVTRMTARIGLDATQPPADPSQWGDTSTTASDVAATYRYITDRLPGDQRSLILDALTNAPQQAADGWDQYFGIPDGLPGVPHAIKQGWMAEGDATILHTTGLVGNHHRYVVVLLTSVPADAGTATRAITAAAATLAPLVDSSR
jgi:hypothetical protein